jgi:hypothetical protein
MGQTTDEYLVFAAACLVIAIVLLRLLLRERITLQVLGAMAVFPRTTDRVAHYLGFTLMSNFLFCTAIAALAILHLRALVTLSKVQLRSVTLTQELALLQERLDRLDGRANDRAPRANPSAR